MSEDVPMIKKNETIEAIAGVTGTILVVAVGLVCWLWLSGRNVVVEQIGRLGGQVTYDEAARGSSKYEDSTVIEADLNCTPVTDTQLEGFSKRLPRLKILKLCATQVTDSGLTHLKEMPQLQQLYLGRTGVGDPGITHLKGLQLQGLDLSYTSLTDGGLGCLMGLRSLRWLRLSNTHVTDAGLEHLERASQLQGLHLGAPRLATLACNISAS